MFIHKNRITVSTDGQGLYKITDLVQKKIEEVKIPNGICYLFVPHTSASIIIQELDPAAKNDMEYFLDKLVPENDDKYRHRMEGPDDPSSHVKGSLLGNSQIVFIENNKLLMGSWQEIYLWEHRRDKRNRVIDIRIISE
ncbi:MAG: secondary thiamine-phosphate synthase enzyme YjbQ [Candidatus Jorgensenbacteria bacterium]